MPKKPNTIQELAQLGGLARARKYSKRQLREWSRRGGRPKKTKDKASHP